MAVTALLAAACSSGDEASTATTSAPVVAAPVTIPASRQTPFCAGMIELTADVQRDPELSIDQIVDRYRQLLPDAPAEIAPVLSAVIDQLLARAPSSTTATTASDATVANPTAAPGQTLPEAEVLGYLPEQDPALQLNDYVQFACRATGNNPGPAPTQPNLAVDTTA